VNVGDGYIVDGAVVVETIPAPVPALIADAYVAESVVDTAVVADMRASKTVVVAVHAAGKPPISGVHR
jgi:GTP:adenosylcobinamide-phosphate guanylyltransferase